MKEYVIRKKTAPLDWAEIPCLAIDEVCWGKSAEGIEACAQLCYDEEKLYVRLSAKEKEIRACYSAPIDPPCLDSCLEFFFAPVEGDSRYFNIEVNPNALVFFGFGHNRYDLVRLLPIDMKIRPQITRTEDGWRAEYEIPRETIALFFPGFAFGTGAVMHANFYKCGDECPVPHYYSWNPMNAEIPDFHRTQDFGKLILG